MFKAIERRSALSPLLQMLYAAQTESIHRLLLFRFGEALRAGGKITTIFEACAQISMP